MKIRVKLFALYKQLVGKEEIILDVPEKLSVEDLKMKLVENFPGLADKSFDPLIAVNMEYARPQQELRESDMVAILPPFSGGILKL